MMREFEELRSKIELRRSVFYLLCDFIDRAIAENNLDQAVLAFTVLDRIGFKR
jgi:hypothetical protein